MWTHRIVSSGYIRAIFATRNGWVCSGASAPTWKARSLPVLAISSITGRLRFGSSMKNEFWAPFSFTP